MQSSKSAASLAHRACCPGTGMACGTSHRPADPLVDSRQEGLTGRAALMSWREDCTSYRWDGSQPQVSCRSHQIIRPPPRRARTCRRLRARHPHRRRHRVRTTRSLKVNPSPSSSARRTDDDRTKQAARPEAGTFSRRTDSPRRQLRRGRVSCDRNRRLSSCSAGCAQAGLRRLSTTDQPHSSKWPRSF
jgi:hypothetical protein